MAEFRITKGKNIKIAGAPTKEVVQLALPQKAAIQPPDFKGLNPRLAVKVGDEVKVGSTLITDKTFEEIRLVSPLAGKVKAINRGHKRALLEVVVESEGPQEAETFNTSGDVKKVLLESGLWPVIRQRPFHKIAEPTGEPKSIFVRAMSTDPLSADLDLILEGKEKEFQSGLDIITRLTKGKVHLCYSADAKSAALKNASGVEKHTFSGPHPTGNVGTHIHYVDPIDKGQVVWFIEAQDVLRISSLFATGKYPLERIVAIGGEGANSRVHAKTIVGAPLSALLQGSNLDDKRCISGSVLSGRNVGKEGYLGFYDSQISVIPEGGERALIGWLLPGFNKFSFSHTIASSFFPRKEYSMDADENGGHRAIVLNHIYEDLNAIEILPYFLIRAIVSGNIEDAEKLGILECDEEDFALCTFACPSKTDVGQIIRDGLDLIEKEG